MRFMYHLLHKISMLENKTYPRQAKQSNTKGKSNQRNKSLNNKKPFENKLPYMANAKTSILNTIPDKKAILEIYLQSVDA